MLTYLQDGDLLNKKLVKTMTLQVACTRDGWLPFCAPSLFLNRIRLLCAARHVQPIWDRFWLFSCLPLLAGRWWNHNELRFQGAAILETQLEEVKKQSLPLLSECVCNSDSEETMSSVDGLLWKSLTSLVLLGNSCHQGLPAVEYSSNPSRWNLRQMVPDILLMILTLLYVVFTFMDVHSSLRMQQILKKSRWLDDEKARLRRIDLLVHD